MFKKIRKFQDKLERNKPLMILYKTVKTIIAIFLLLVLSVILFQKVTDNNITIGGIRIFNVASGSMYPEYEIGDIIIINETTPDEINIGDNITYLGETGNFDKIIVTHKVIEKREENGEHYFITKGVSNDLADPEITFSQVYGKVIYKTVILSYISKLMSNAVAYFVIFTIISLYASFQIVKMIFDEKNDDDELDDTQKEVTSDGEKE